MGIRLEAVGNLIVFSASLFAVLGKENLSPGLVGLSVTYAMSVTMTLNWLVRTATGFETSVVAAERIKEYSETEQEANWSLDTDEKHDSWPSKGVIQFRNVHAKYRAGLPLVLKDLSFTIDAQQKLVLLAGQEQENHPLH